MININIANVSRASNKATKGEKPSIKAWQLFPPF